MYGEKRCWMLLENTLKPWASVAGRVMGLIFASIAATILLEGHQVLLNEKAPR